MKFKWMSFTIFMLFYVDNVFGIAFYQSKNGNIEKITQQQFESDCESYIYRTVALSELPASFKKKATDASLYGDSVNALPVLIKQLKDMPNSCSYGLDTEKIK